MVYNWLLETEIEFGVAVVIVALRVFARWKTVGFAGRQGDDYLILIALLCYALMAAMYPKLYRGTLFQPSKHMTKEQMETWITSIKYNQALWTVYVCYIWSLKGCMLFFFARLTKTMERYRLVKITAWLCGITFVICIVELYVHCLPLRKMWQLTPYPGKVCRTSMVNFYVIGSLNFTTDAILLSIPIPLLYRLNATLKRKLLIGLLLCSGVFVMCATLIRAVSGLLSVYNPKIKASNVAIAFACRENFLSIIVVNAPCIKPLLFPKSWIKRRGGQDAVLPLSSSTGASSMPEQSSGKNHLAPASIDARSIYTNTDASTMASGNLESHEMNLLRPEAWPRPAGTGR